MYRNLNKFAVHATKNKSNFNINRQVIYYFGQRVKNYIQTFVFVVQCIYNKFIIANTKNIRYIISLLLIKTFYFYKIFLYK